MHILLESNAWSQHRAAIAADAALQQAIVDTLLQRCLPATEAAVVEGRLPAGLPLRPGGHTTAMLFCMSCVLQHDSLAPAAESRLQAGGAVAALHHAAAILLALPTVRPAGAFSQAWSFNLSSASALLAGQCQQIVLQQQGAQVAAAQHDSGATLTVQLGGEAAGTAVWQSATVLPRMAASLVALTGELEAHSTSSEQRDSRLRDLFIISNNLRLPIYFVWGLQLEECSPQQLSCWLAAAAASLRLLPCFAFLCAQLKQHNCYSDSERKTAARLCPGLLMAVAAGLPEQLSQLAPALQRLGSRAAQMPPEQAAAWEGLPAQLWALHTGTAVGTAHWHMPTCRCCVSPPAWCAAHSRPVALTAHLPQQPAVPVL